MTPHTVVACCQLAPRVGDVAHNREISLQAIHNAARQGAQVIVLPELMQSGYVFTDHAHALNLAETATGATVSAWCEAARALDIVIVAGFCERLDSTRVSNSAALIDVNGVQAIYRKAHLWDQEKHIFTPGNEPPPVVQTRFGLIGMMICFDLEFPEWVRLPALAGAELLCAPVNWPASPRPVSERPCEVVRVQANAAVNRMFIAACDRTGTERNVDWVGGSVIVDADGYPLAGPLETPSNGPAMILATLDLKQARHKRISALNHVHADRRTDLYDSARRA
ncbi:nitrilase family protein [Pseudomonas weihenstephanensis]|uniref:Carbon-nitrogen hydrolase n=1 Tax=Pseudomonas weihenstephanensis TaxID=1608994 RepID=A0ABS1ZM63_9PSED|nr:nitrilase family protein [Pseudomonas weihenstephanensis]MBM1197578.1 carbon-nitrogen hydrolase [Pseudomonas weihenstephanensis]